MNTKRVATWLVLSLCTTLGACAPRLYQRETLKLDHRDLDQFQIHYAEFDSCLWRRAVPVSYRLKRPQYVLRMDVHFGDDRHTAGLDVSLSGSGTLTARFPGLSAEVAAKSVTAEGSRYRLDAAQIGETLTIDVLRDGALLGEESLTVKRERCRAMSLGEDSEGAEPAAPAP